MRPISLTLQTSETMSSVYGRARRVPRKAIILAGGLESKLPLLPDEQTSALLPVATRPLLAWQIRALADNGIEEIGLALSPRNVEPVERMLRAENGSAVKVHCAVESVPRGPA